MPISAEAYRDALRHFPSGVTIVTIAADGERHGLTVSAFASITPVPPTVMIAIDKRHRAHALLHEAGAVFAVNILRAEHQALSNRFAWVKDEDRFAVGRWTQATTGAPILEDALAWLDCTVLEKLEAGTHTIFLGRIEDSAVPEPDALPLVYWNRTYRDLSADA